MSKYPKAIDSDLVGKYPALVKAGAGYFFDEVLEYRVWFRTESKALDDQNGDDYYYSFETYEDALQFSKEHPGSEEPLVLIRQLEWINEPKAGKYIHMKGKRITEWMPEWLSCGSRKPGDIEKFIANGQNS